MSLSQLRLAPHISFGGLDNPLLKAIVGSTDPIDHIEWAHGNGFAGIQDPFTALRTPEEQNRIGETVDRLGMVSGSFVYAGPPVVGKWWTEDSGESRQALDRVMVEAVEIAQRIRSRHVAILALADPNLPRAEQLLNFRNNLEHFASRFDGLDILLCLEAVNRHRLPQMLLHHLDDAHDIVTRIESGTVRLIFDFGHVQAMDGNIAYHLDKVWNAIEVIQIADNPGRIEPGAGELNFEFLLRELRRREFSGLCELEHGWSRTDSEYQLAVLDQVKRWACE